MDNLKKETQGLQDEKEVWTVLTWYTYCINWRIAFTPTNEMITR